MITNFEELTKDLSVEEMTLALSVVSLLEKHKKENPIKAPSILKHFNGNPNLFSNSEKLSGVRFRKIVNAIRSNGIAPIIATSKGYYITFDKEEIRKQIASLEERAWSITNAGLGLSALLLEIEFQELEDSKS